jgi:dTDP-4-amino-4,6-dideoxygalactose transaminase
LRDHGSERKYHHEIIGYNFRLEGLQGAVLSVKLRYLDEWNGLRREHAALYSKLLTESGLTLPVELPYGEHVYHLYVIQHGHRDALRVRLEARGVQTGIHYPVPIHLQPAYAAHGHQRGDFPVTEWLADRILSLPMFAELTAAQIEYVAESVATALATDAAAVG